jgi:tetratricopeptide (TPR) repeat protein
LGQLEAAEATLKSSLSYAQAMLGADSADVRDIHSALANVAINRRHGIQAEENASAGLTTCKMAPADMPHVCFNLRRQLAHARYLQHNHIDALDIRVQVLADLRTRSAEIDLLDQHIDLAASFIALKRWREALEQAQIAESKLARSENDRQEPELALYMGEALFGLNRLDEAIATFESARGLAGDDPDLRAATGWRLAQAKCATGRDPVQAKELAREASTHFQGNRNDPEVADIIKSIDEVLRSDCLSKTQR